MPEIQPSANLEALGKGWVPSSVSFRLVLTGVYLFQAERPGGGYLVPKDPCVVSGDRSHLVIMCKQLDTIDFQQLNFIVPQPTRRPRMEVARVGIGRWR